MASEIKANKISPATGTALTIGDSGDTFTVPSGATLAVASGATISNAGTASGFGKVLQVVQAVKTDTFTTTSSTYVDLTGLSLNITPSSSSNKILISYIFESNTGETVNQVMSRLMRDATAIGIGDAAGSRTQTSTGMKGETNFSNGSAHVVNFLDSPSTTSSVTYKVQVRCSVNGQTGYISRTQTDTDNANYSRSIATITAMEIEG
jgi:hypothetical protein